MTRSFSSLLLYRATLLLAALGFYLIPTSGHADAYPLSSSPYVLQQALATKDHINLYGSAKGTGLNISGGFFSGRASGVDPIATNYLAAQSNQDFHIDHTAELENDQRVTALLIDGSYDFNYDLGTGLPIHPYMTSGMGMAMYSQPNGPSASTLAMQSSGMTPLFRVGGGVTYRLGEQWDMSLDYKAGFSSGNDQFFTGRSQQPVDLQVLNMGMHYQF